MTKRVISNLIHKLPTGFRFPFDVASFCLLDTSKNWKLPAYIIRGELAGEGLQGSIIYFSELHQYRIWVDRIFATAYDPEPLGPISLVDILKRSFDLPEHDLMLCPVNPLTERFFRRCGWRTIPLYVNCVLDLDKTLLELIKEPKRDYRYLNKLNFTHKVLADDASLEEFYNTMLVPTTLTQHKDNAFVSSLDSMRERFKKGFLLGLYDSTTWIAGMLVSEERNYEVRAANMGWRNGDSKLLSNHVAAALYMTTITWAKEKGYRRLNFGGSHPFANDGVLGFKLRRKPQLQLPRISYAGNEMENLKAYLATYFNFATESGRAILKHTPLLERFKGNIQVIGWNSTLRSEVQKQVDQGLPLIDLAQQ